MGDIKTIYLIRHGQSEKNADKTLYYSETKYDHLVGLTEKGRQQSKECGQRLAQKITGPFTTFVSPYLRATATLDLILPEIPRPPSAKIVDGRLERAGVELFLSEKELTDARVERERQGALNYRFINGESGYDVLTRVGVFFNQLRTDWILGHRDDEVIIVCHEVVCRCFMLLALEWPPEKYDQISTDNCNIHVLKAGPKLLFGKKNPRQEG